MPVSWARTWQESWTSSWSGSIRTSRRWFSWRTIPSWHYQLSHGLRRCSFEHQTLNQSYELRESRNQIEIQHGLESQWDQAYLRKDHPSYRHYHNYDQRYLMDILSHSWPDFVGDSHCDIKHGDFIYMLLIIVKNFKSYPDYTKYISNTFIKYVTYDNNLFFVQHLFMRALTHIRLLYILSYIINEMI